MEIKDAMPASLIFATCAKYIRPPWKTVRVPWPRVHVATIVVKRPTQQLYQ